MPEYTQEQIDALVAEKVTGLKAKNGELLGDIKDFKAKLAKYDGVNPDRLAELEKAEKDREAANAKKRGDWEELAKRKDDEHAAQMAAKDKAMAAKDAKLEDALIGSAVTEAITGAEGSTVLLNRIVRELVHVEDGQVVVVDADGTRRLTDEGGHMTIPQLVDEFKQNAAYAGAFAGTGSQGSGSPTVAGRGKLPVGTVDANDPVAMGKNLQAILDGKVVAI